ncbi:hypothetical protein LTR36_002747 [Oleoguttula mirabilis]|uniref:Alpha/beta hydrolase fold-3 domain-containing protein n=1 Tax=Oleoguttula mirabilis TaxID=1507867 RepID=A0AAV9JLD0_9PEZI|nr:hypothetical protein LTR36_002747 [Oleoguttula mirabilis]
MLLEPDELKNASEIDPQILEFAENNPSPPMDWDNAAATAAGMAAMEAMLLAQIGPPESAITEHAQQIPMRDGFESTIKIHKPSSPPSAGSPLIVLILGGGWISGSKDQLTPFARAMVRLFGAVVVNISHRLAPQFKFPKGAEDAWDSVKWIAAHASELGADPALGFVVGGVSAGGNLTAVVTALSIEEKLNPPITGQWLCTPALMDEQHVPEKYKKYFLSREHNAHAPVLDRAALAALKKHVEWDDDSPLRFPVLSKAPLKDLPPTYFQADGMDPIRDDAMIYDEMLKEAGVKTKIDFYPGCPHGHMFFMPGIELSNRGLSDMFAGFGWLLGKEISGEEGLKAMAPAS